jgi:Stress responsive A/B Barrel Domain
MTPGKFLGHMVYFTLKDRSETAIQALIEACKKYLTGHPGTVLFAAGTLTPDLARPVNDREFDVALQVVFDSRASHDAYQIAPRHLQFIEENKPNWAKVRVFDADVSC